MANIIPQWVGLADAINISAYNQLCSTDVWSIQAYYALFKKLFTVRSFKITHQHVYNKSHIL